MDAVLYEHLNKTVREDPIFKEFSKLNKIYIDMQLANQLTGWSFQRPWFFGFVDRKNHEQMGKSK